MGFTSMDDFINEVTTNGKFWRADWNKSTLPTTNYAAGTWYDWTLSPGNPVAAPTFSGGTNLTSSSFSESNGFGIYNAGSVSSDSKHALNVSAYSAVAASAASRSSTRWPSSWPLA